MNRQQKLILNLNGYNKYLVRNYKERIDYYFDSSEMMNYFILNQTFYN